MYYSLFYLSNLVNTTEDAAEAIQWLADIDDKEQEYCIFVQDEEGDTIVALVDSRNPYNPQIP